VGRANNANNVGNADNVYGVAAPNVSLFCAEVFAAANGGRTYQTPSAPQADGTTTELWARICDPLNVTHAANAVMGYVVPEDHYDALRARAKAWVDHRAEREASLLRRLQDGYVFSPYDQKKVYEPKERDIHYHSDWADNIAERSVLNVLEPVFMAHFSAHAFGSIKGRGTTNMMKYVAKAFSDHPNATFFQMDVRKYYEHIDMTQLKTDILAAIPDLKVQDFLFRLVDSYEGPGIPIGAPLSQFHANLYLTYIDRQLEQHHSVLDFARNMDDIIIITPDKNAAQQVRREMVDWLAARALEMKPNWRIAPMSYGADIVGYVIRPTHVALRKKTKLHMQRRARQLSAGHVPDKVFKQQMGGFYGWATHGDCRHLLQITLGDKLKLFNKKKRMDFKQLKDLRPSSFFGLSKARFVSITTLNKQQILILKSAPVTIKHVEKVAILFCYAGDAAKAANEDELAEYSHYTITRSAVMADRLERDRDLFPCIVTVNVGKYISYN
jgi:hypothetical protein